MNPIPLPQYNPSCTDCKLHTSGAKTICMGGRFLSGPQTGDVALLVVGEAPGMNEDNQGLPFVGKSGTLLIDGFLKGSKADSYADIYLTNAVRCRPPQNATPTPPQMKACYKYLEQDIQALQKAYRKVVILALGAVASRAVGAYKTLKEAFRHQGDLHPQYGMEVFYTFHPSACLRDSKNVPPTKKHFELVRFFLETGNLPVVEKAPPVEGWLEAPPKFLDDAIAFDIETYGVLQGQPQNYFHPMLSQRLDFVRPPDQIVTASVAWKDVDPPHALHTAVFIWGNTTHRARFFEYLARAKKWAGMNIGFDIQYLLQFNPDMMAHNPILLDISILSFLLDDLAPERSLKSIAPLLEVTRYGDLSHMGRYKNALDPELWKYNCHDTFATYRCTQKLLQSLTTKYPNLDITTVVMWWSDVLKECIQMSASGVTFNRPVLAQARDVIEKRLETLIADSKARGLILSGTGSQKSTQAIIDAAAAEIDTSLAGRLDRTDKTRRISTSDNNRNILLSDLNLSPGLRVEIETIDTFVRARKLLTSALAPLLDKWCGIGTGRTYPVWFAVPTHVKDDSGESGGTRQARLTCKGPALQTLPPSVRNTQISRWDGGTIISIDASQIELRVAAMLSGDKNMVEEYELGIDRHLLRATKMFYNQGAIPGTAGVAEWIKRHADFCKKSPVPEIREGFDAFIAGGATDSWYTSQVLEWQRQVGKTINFLIQFRGGAVKAQHTIRSDIGMHLSVGFLMNQITETYGRYPGLVKWQDDRIATVKACGYLQLWSGLRRTFYDPASTFSTDSVDFDKLIPQIVNFEIQSYAAMLTEGAAIFIRKALEGKKDISGWTGPLPSITWNQYDSIFVDIPPGLGVDQVSYLQDTLKIGFERPQYLQQFLDVCHPDAKRVPLESKIKTISGPELFTT